VEACCSGKHARQVKALHYRQLVVHIGEAGYTLMPWLGVNGVRGFAEELRGIRTEPPEGFKSDRVERISRALLVDKVVPALGCVPKNSGMARGAGGGEIVRSRQWMDENETSARTAMPGAQVAVKVPGCLGAGGTPGVSAGAGCYFGNAVAVCHCVEAVTINKGADSKQKELYGWKSTAWKLTIHQHDVKTAFLKGELIQDMHIQLPPG
jgi:hypothetical protein